MPLADIDLEFLAEMLDQNDYDTAFVNPVTGEVYYTAGDQALPDDVDVDDLIGLGGGGSRDAYRYMETFAASVTDQHVAELLRVALQGAGAFRRFKNVIHHQNEALSDRWYAYRDACSRIRAVEFLIDHEVCDATEGTTVIAELAAQADQALAPDLSSSPAAPDQEHQIRRR